MNAAKCWRNFPRRAWRLKDEQPCGVSIGGKCNLHPAAFDSSDDFLSVAPATFQRAAFRVGFDFFRAAAAPGIERPG
jgi:hypothetical protein